MEETALRPICSGVLDNAKVYSLCCDFHKCVDGVGLVLLP